MDSSPIVEAANVAAEQALLGCLLVRDTIYYLIHNDISDLDFFDARNALIFKTLGLIAAANSGRFNITTIKDYLSRGSTGSLVGEDYLESLMDAVADPGEAQNYVIAVVDCARRRRAIKALRDSINKLIKPVPGVALGELIENITSDVLDAARADPTTCKTLGEYADDAFNRLERVYYRQETILALDWPITAITDTCGPALPGDLVTLAGRSGWGKSSLALQVAEHWGKTTPGLVFSLEMRGVEHANRSLAQKSRIAAWRLTRSAVRSEDELGALAAATEAMANLPIWIDERPRLTMNQIRAKAIGFKRRHGIKWLIVDHAHIIQTSGRESRFEAVYDLCTTLKTLAKELDCVVLILAQLNSEGRNRKSDRPIARDINYYPAFEQSSDAIFFCYRPEVGLAEQQPEGDGFDLWKQRLEESKGKAEIINVKARSGPPMKAKPCRFNGELMRFEEGMEAPQPFYKGESQMANEDF